MLLFLVFAGCAGVPDSTTQDTSVDPDSDPYGICDAYVACAEDTTGLSDLPTPPNVAGCARGLITGLTWMEAYCFRPAEPTFKDWADYLYEAGCPRAQAADDCEGRCAFVHVPAVCEMGPLRDDFWTESWLVCMDRCAAESGSL